MRQRKQGTGRKFSYYIAPAIGEGFRDFCDETPSNWIGAAEVAWMALPAEVREAIRDDCRGLPLDKAVRHVRRLIRDAMAEQILVEHARTLPRSEQARIIQKTMGKATR